MKFLKKFNENLDYNVGDYVLVTPESVANMSKEYADFVSNNYGKIVKIPSNRINLTAIKYDNIPQNMMKYFKNNTSMFFNPEIVDYAKTKEELELKLSSRKYNL